ncbi:hypothetical protein LP422_17030 [Janibacter limosus]|uniref:Uncharacterized protein n=1 Tax=Janibacter limosus TaxID=53458 RepID=A0AC61U2I0_9MICO|nr:hypothetical protein [Janibacter limosus]UUZ44216.1 hypothetical protein LP422_17030 [Janibacter limosus]
MVVWLAVVVELVVDEDVSFFLGFVVVVVDEVVVVCEVGMMLLGGT